MKELKIYELSDSAYGMYLSIDGAEADVRFGSLFYAKKEADKVIAELEEKHKTEVKELLCLIRDKVNNFNRAFDSEEKEIRRQKYKRCLANAEACMHKRWRPDEGFDYARSTRHMNKWLAIAEKFKTNSTAQ